jgi:hypothetical protein
MSLSVSGLNILCDDCVINSGISRRMNGHQLDKVLVDQQGNKVGDLGPLYTCHCGRFYSGLAGYFSYVPNEGLGRKRFLHCRDTDCDQTLFMYITRTLSADKATRRDRAACHCPNCELEQERDLSPVA